MNVTGKYQQGRTRRLQQLDAFLPAFAAAELAPGAALRLAAEPLRRLNREVMLAWNPRLVRVRPNAAKLVARLQQVLAIKPAGAEPALRR